MMFKIEINTDNAAFHEDYGASEIDRIVRNILDKLLDGQTKGSCIDINGNKVGHWELD